METAFRGRTDALRYARFSSLIHNAAWLPVTLRILHVINTFDRGFGGGPAVVATLAAAQAAAGDRPRVACAGARRKLDAVAPTAAPRGAILAVTRCGSLAGGLEALLADADVVHVHDVWTPFTVGGLWRAHRHGVGTVLTPHGSLTAWGMARSGLKKRLALALLWRRAIGTAGVIQALNPDEAREIAALVPGAHVAMVPNGVAQEAAGGATPGAARHVLFLSHFARNKQPRLLIGAFASIAARLPDLGLVMAGDDLGEVAACRRLAADRGIADRVRFAGPVHGQEKERLLSDALCVCLPTQHEACSMTLLEALARGIPVVTTPEARMPEVARMGAGLVVAPTPAAFADAILSLATDRGGRAAMADAGRALIARDHDLTAITARVHGLYLAAIARRQPSRPVP